MCARGLLSDVTVDKCSCKLKTQSAASCRTGQQITQSGTMEMKNEEAEAAECEFVGNDGEEYVSGSEG